MGDVSTICCLDLVHHVVKFTKATSISCHLSLCDASCLKKDYPENACSTFGADVGSGTCRVFPKCLYNVINLDE